MKIALVNTLYAPYQVGGAERSTQELAEGLAQRGHAVAVITLGEARLEGRGAINGVTVYRLPLENWYWPYSGSLGNAAARSAWHLRDFRNGAMSARVASVLDLVRPDIVHTNSLAGFSVALWSQATRRRLPIVHTLHDYYLMCPPSAMYRTTGNCAGICARCLPFAAYRRRASRAVDAVVGVSRFILERHVRAGFFERCRTAKVVFPWPPRASGRTRKARSGPPVFGFIGRLCAEKGIEWLLEVFATSAPPGASLVVAGKGQPGFVDSLKARFSSPGVTFLGHVDPAVFYAQVDVVVVPSLWNEAFGRTALEPLAYGIPVIASHRGGLAEIIEDGVTGLLVDPDEAGSLGRAMNRCSAEPELVGRLGRNGPQRLSRFSEDAALDAYASLYAQLIRTAEPRASLAGARSTSVARAKR